MNEKRKLQKYQVDLINKKDDTGIQNLLDILDGHS